MSEFRVNSITNQDGIAGPQVCGVSTFSGKSGVRIPSGSTDFRRKDGGGRGVGLTIAGNNGSNTSNIEKIEIATKGNAVDFGDVRVANTAMGSCASSVRGLAAGGQQPSSYTKNIDFINIVSGGTAVNFGQLLYGRDWPGALSNNILGLFAGGRGDRGGGGNGNNIIDFVTIASTGDATEFGELIEPGGILVSSHNHPQKYYRMTAASPTRGIITGAVSPSYDRSIQFITFATKGNGQSFGTLSQTHTGGAGCSNSTRAIFGGGYSTYPSLTNIIDFVTIATTGNASDFGDLTNSPRGHGAMASSTRGLFSGGATPSTTNVIQFVTISTTGDAVDFGDCVAALKNRTACSDVHGGLAQ